MVENFKENGQITVGKLIELLKQYPSNETVWIEDYEYYGAANAVEFKDGMVMIRRCN